MRKQIWKRLGWSITALEDKKKCFAWLFFFFVLQLILQYYYPMTSDDLYFRYGVEISNKNDLFNYVLHFGNGRYLGNSSVLILVRCHWLRALSKAVIMTAIYGELIYLLDLKNELQIAFAGILMLLPSVKMYAQVYVWTAGFQNYIVPIFLYLTAILCWKKCKEAKENGEDQKKHDHTGSWKYSWRWYHDRRSHASKRRHGWSEQLPESPGNVGSSI